MIEDITVVEFLALAIVLIYVIHNFSQKDVDITIKISVFVTCYLSVGIILLLPYDIYLTRLVTLQEYNLESDDRYKRLVHAYTFFYYSIFFLCWVLIPIQQGCENSGYHRFEDRLKYSLKINGIFYCIMGIIGFGFVTIIMYIGLEGEYGLINFFKSLANCWGIFLIMILLGYSLVLVPKAHWRTTNTNQQLKYLYFQSGSISEEQEQYMSDLLDGIIQVLDVMDKTQNSKDQEEIYIYCQKALELVSQKFVQNCREFLLTEENQKRFSKKRYSIEDSINIYLYVKSKYAEVRRTRCEWLQVSKSAFLLEDIQQNYNNENKQIVSNIREPCIGFMAEQRDFIKWFWYTRLKTKAKMILAIFLTIMSVLIIIEETALDVKGFYGVFKNKNTDASSLLFTSINFSRVSVPLCLNFLNILNIKDAAINKAIGNINLVPVLGESFPQYFPIVLIVLVLFNYFDLYSTIQSWFGLSGFQFTPHFDSKQIQLGKEILNEKRAKIKRQMKKDASVSHHQFNDYEQNKGKTSVYMQLLDFDLAASHTRIWTCFHCTTLQSESLIKKID
ncbi:hypothetical protein PPERSA_09771 [Pseudocohnilembus persalinus]|uniref:LMBR1-like membrane protein n=1 Tax=Pseudocohnilembus persalinus TaxID=266149 RepID=A0A0V0QTL2_PSEPJ|nr:hypothetical protein PPERSA_09771 [Pseudocohnilembus persalinus]|eukprot:KRX05631.1 hypothetical protein PPERSA_09771 [Pseudocohnilembus persalinus]